MGSKKSKKAQSKSSPLKEGSLLGDFCVALIDNYNPPKRTRREKGIPTAVSVTKFATSVYALVGWANPPQALRSLAEQTGNNYTMVRRWTREKVFNDLVMSHMEAFVVVFFNYLKQWHGRFVEVMDAAQKQPLSSISYKASDNDRDALLQELKTKLHSYYCPRLSIVLVTLLSEEIKATKDFGWCSTLLAASRIISAPIIGYQTEEFLKLRRHTACHIIDLSKKEITKPMISLNDKKSLLLALDMVSEDVREGRL